MKFNVTIDTETRTCEMKQDGKAVDACNFGAGSYESGYDGKVYSYITWAEETDDGNMVCHRIDFSATDPDATMASVNKASTNIPKEIGKIFDMLRASKSLAGIFTRK